MILPADGLRNEDGGELFGCGARPRVRKAFPWRKVLGGACHGDVAFGDHLPDGPCLVDGGDGFKQRADSSGSSGEILRAAVHRPARICQFKFLLDESALQFAGKKPAKSGTQPGGSACPTKLSCRGDCFHDVR